MEPYYNKLGQDFVGFFFFFSLELMNKAQDTEAADGIFSPLMPGS